LCCFFCRGGTYRDWLETVYTAGKYLDRPETPVFIGGMTQYIEFDEVISKSATETALDGIGYQDLIQEQMVGETSTYNGGATIDKIKHLAANKTVAWIDYMTNYKLNEYLKKGEAETPKAAEGQTEGGVTEPNPTRDN
jgi:hypothetical protein